MRYSGSQPARRRLLQLLFAGAAGAVLPCAQSAQAKKYSKERVGYRDEPYQGRTCARCMLYVGDGECAIVEGQIRPDGWCVQWTPATFGQTGSGLA